MQPEIKEIDWSIKRNRSNLRKLYKEHGYNKDMSFKDFREYAKNKYFRTLSYRGI